MYYTLEDMKKAFDAGYDRSTWEDRGYSDAESPEFKEFLQKNYPQDVTYQWMILFEMEPSSKVYHKMIMAENIEEAQKLALLCLGKEEIYPNSYSLHKVELESGHYLWDCKALDDGVCQYNVILDPEMDNCVFCHEPQERK